MRLLAYSVPDLLDDMSLSQREYTQGAYEIYGIDESELHNISPGVASLKCVWVTNYVRLKHDVEVISPSLAALIESIEGYSTCAYSHYVSARAIEDPRSPLMSDYLPGNFDTSRPAYELAQFIPALSDE